MKLVESEGMNPKDPKAMNFERLYGAVLDICRTKETLSELVNVQHYAEEASDLVDRSPGKPTVLDVPSVIQPAAVDRGVEKWPDTGVADPVEELARRLEAIVLPITTALAN